MNSSFVFLDVNDEELVKKDFFPFSFFSFFHFQFFLSFFLTQVEDLARYISTLKKEEGDVPPFTAEVLALLAKGKTEEIAAKFAAASSVLVTAPSKELEGAFNLLICYLRKVKKEVLHGLVLQVIEPFSSQQLAGKVTHFLSVLGNLYSQLEPNNPTRYDVYVTILKFGTKQHRLQSLQGGFAHVDEWLAEWGVEVQKKRDLYLLIRDILNAHEQQ